MSELTGDEKQWALSSDDKLYEIAKDWAKGYSTKELRAFQAHYIDVSKTAVWDEDRYKSYNNRWKCVTYAISIRNFGV